MTSLDIDTIQELLKQDKVFETVHPRPVQLGPLQWKDTTDRCAARGCSTPTYIRIGGIPYCTSHALYALNLIVIKTQPQYNTIPYNDCNCKAGRHSMMNIHTDDCVLFGRIKESKEKEGQGLDDRIESTAGTTATG
jgi:hypothetical protein